MVRESHIDVKAAAITKQRRIQRSPKYRSFFDDAGVNALAWVEGSAFAGRSIERTEQAKPDVKKR